MRDKQIEEMAFDMSESLVYFKGEPQIINWVKTLENMHTKGYRKASDVVREAIDELERRLYSVSHRETSITGYSYSVVDIDEIAYEVEELKKKYESESNK